jgi:hypothetical protein
MRSVLFFLLVFSTLLGVLYFFVEKDPVRRPPVGITEDDNPEDDSEGANTVEIPIHNTKKGRLEYVLRGELDDALIQNVQDIGEFEHGVLHHGEIEIPIYEDMARDLPSSSASGPSIFRLTFNRAEYSIEEDEGRKRQVVKLLDGGTGTSDDGTVIKFEEMSVRIEKVTGKKVFSLASDRPVSIANDMITIESLTGMEGKFQEDRKLETVLFHPPVSAFVSAKSARFFSLKDDGDSRDGDGGKEEDSDEDKNAGLVAITCEGELRFDRTADTDTSEERTAQTILLEKDVRIFQLDERVPGEWPLPTDTWFHCQRFEIFFDRATEDAPPSIREAVATWPGGRVLAAHRTLRADGDKLTWNQTEARLVGRPTFADENFKTSCEEATFKLNEDLVVLDGDVRGDFALRRPSSASDGESSVAAKDFAKKDEPEKNQARMNFEASHAEIYVQDNRDAAKTSKAARANGERSAREKADEALSSIRRFVARSDEDDGLVLRSSDGKFFLRGRRFSYDAKAGKITVEGGVAKRPYFEHGESRGEARVIELFLDQQLLRLVDDVDVQLEVTKDQQGAQAVPASDPPPPGKKSPGLVRLKADLMDVAIDFDGETVLWAEARGSDGRFVSLSPAGSDASVAPYRVVGPVLHWDHSKRLATLASPNDDPESFPRIEFESGRLRAREIIFERDSWKASLQDGVEISSVVGKNSDGAGGKPILFVCDRAEVEFYEKLEPRGDDLDDRLRSVRKLHAWRSEESPMVIEGPDFSARGHEATWTAETRELKLFGEGQQEFRRREGKREEVLRADEITFLRAMNRLELRRNVSGQIRQPESRAEPTSTDKRAGVSRTLEWKFETDILDVHLRDGGPGKGLTIDRLQAFQRVQLVCEQEGIQLHGDDLVYHADRHLLRIFSSDDRFQTLKRVHEDTAESGQGSPLTDEIHAREIRLIYYRTEPLPGDDRYTVTEVKVKFTDDVTAAFHNIGGNSSRLPLRSSKRESGPKSRAHVWKFRSDSLHLHLMPKIVGRGKFQSAYADGNVDISCAEEDVSAKSQEAFYSEADKRLILRGDAENKVYLKYGDAVYNRDEYVEIRQLGNEDMNVVAKKKG